MEENYKDTVNLLVKDDAVTKHYRLVLFVALAAAIIAEIVCVIHGVSSYNQLSAGEARLDDLQEVYAELVEKKGEIDASSVERSETSSQFLPKVELLDVYYDKDSKSSSYSMEVAGAEIKPSDNVEDADFDNLVDGLNAIVKAQNDYSNSLLSADEARAVASSVDKYLGPDDAEARVPWYYGEDNCTWSYAPLLLEKTEKYPVIWLGENSDGQVVCMATATYDFSIEKFVNIQYRQIGDPSEFVEDTVGAEIAEEDSDNEAS